MRFVIIFLLSLTVATTVSRHAWAQQNSSSGARVALVIGNSKYPDSDAPLKDALNDARELANELRRDGFDVDIGDNLSKQAMRTALDRLYGKIKSGSVVVIFFSGYGIQSDRQSYMIPIDAQIWAEPDVRRDGFSVDAMLKEMNSRGAKVKVAILNASRRNPYERRFHPIPGGLAPVIAPPDSLIMYAAAPGTIATESNADRSLFVTELIAQMRKPGLTGEEVFTQTRFSVTGASRSEQTPWVSSSLTEQFYFSPETQRDSKSAAENTTRQREPERRSAPATDRNEQARLDYQRAEQSGTRRAWEDFLAKHPTGQYAMLAEDQLAKLNSPRVSSRPTEPEPPAEKAPTKKPVADDDAIRDLNRRLANNAQDIDARARRGTRYAQNGEYSLAVRDFNEVIRANPQDADALNNRCWARAMLNELQPALKDCNEALRIRPRFADALDSRGLVKLKLGQAREALSDYDASLQISANQVFSLYGRGIAKVRSGDRNGGNNDIATAKSINPRIADEFAGYGIR